jgi:FAD synthase
VRVVNHGRRSLARAVAVVGIWDPFTLAHRSLLSQLHDEAVVTQRSSLVVLIDPQPGAYAGAQRYGTAGWPVYDAVVARISMILDLGIDAVLCVHFRQGDFGASAAEFLDTVRRNVELDELWLGELQMLGPGRSGDQAAVVKYAQLQGFRVTILPRAPLYAYDVRWLLATGQVKKAVEQVQRLPTWQAPRSLTLPLAWRPGPYRAVALDRPGGAQKQPELGLRLEANGTGPPTLQWPDRRIRYLGFISGPADREDDPA